ncbi:MAG TPA: MBL fold metallo-hydrolase [Dehalococcoidia bacterium]|jgi:Zn-dependent hydrolases, including glyoxylases|nr:MBL fold metallo-hydrolase [Dehalococcoidia bacterium]
MVDIKEVAENIILIDNQLYSIPKWGSVYLINEERKALVDTGPTTSVNTVLKGMEKAGVAPGEINYIIITHIHLDHAGGAGELIKHMPGAKVIVHDKGARHLVNPERLMKSFASTMGERMVQKTGPVAPIAEERVIAVSGGEVFQLGGKQSLRILHMPGHAPHQLCILESQNNGLFSGDAAGILVADGRVLMPATPPPAFDLELSLSSLEELGKLKASAIYFAHFGATDKVRECIKVAMNKLKAWNMLISQAFNEGGFEFAFKKIKAQLYSELEPAKGSEALYQYLADGIVAMNVTGLLKYYQDRKARAEKVKR